MTTSKALLDAWLSTKREILYFASGHQHRLIVEDDPDDGRRWWQMLDVDGVRRASGWTYEGMLSYLKFRAFVLWS